MTGDYAYGYLRTETGVHRLVRKSPFDSNARRHTSFASVFVYPEVDETIEVEINPADLRIDTFRASGAGGQHINKTDSAVRITHLPTNIVVQCQNDRSQHRNRAEAMAMLKSRLYELELRKRQAEQQKLEDAKTDIGWGHQIRSYVLDQSRIKDLRTNVEVGNTQARARRRPRRVHRGEPEAGGVSVSEDQKTRRVGSAGGREPDHCRAARQAQRVARARPRVPERFPARCARRRPACAHGAKNDEELEPQPVTVSVAGRMMLKRVMGKASFATLQDMSGRIQLYITRDALGAEAHERSSTGIWATSSARRGTLFKTTHRRAVGQGDASCACWPSRCVRCRRNSTVSPTRSRSTGSATSISSPARNRARVFVARSTDRPGDARILRRARLSRGRDADDASDPRRRGGAARSSRITTRWTCSCTCASRPSCT